MPEPRLPRRHVVAGLGLGALGIGSGANAHTLGGQAEIGWMAASLSEAGSGLKLIGSENPDLRLPMCSSFKWLLAAQILSRCEAGEDQLTRRLSFRRADLLPNSPITAQALAQSGAEQADMSLADLCRAAITVSDNAAADLLLQIQGGPAGLTTFLRRIGDPVTRLDRIEPELNHVPRGDPRDTTTARAMVGTLNRLLFGTGLKPSSRAKLMEWMRATETGATRLKAGLPPGWRIAHKTGTMPSDYAKSPPERGASGDVGVLFPPKGSPILIAAYEAGSPRSQSQIDAWFAHLAARISRWHS